MDITFLIYCIFLSLEKEFFHLKTPTIFIVLITSSSFANSHISRHIWNLYAILSYCKTLQILFHGK